MKILVRLPNWLGDMVMSSAFIEAVHRLYPGAEVDVIVKKGIDSLVAFIPGITKHYIFSKDQWKGLRGNWAFGKYIKKSGRYDLFFCLPDSFSSAIMGLATGSRQRVGFKKEGRGLFLSKNFSKPHGRHRVEEYIALLELYAGSTIENPVVLLKSNVERKASRIIINLNSEASSRRMPVPKAISILNLLMEKVKAEWVFIGAPNEVEHVEAIINGLKSSEDIINLAGKTDLNGLFETIASGSLMLTTDSGPAHVANALGLHTVVLFGAGNENNTAPYNKINRTILRLGKLDCEPCVKNICKFGLPKCLEMLDEQLILEATLAYSTHK